MCSKNVSVVMPQSAIKLKRANKPMMERRRRERINRCLNELKSLVLNAQKKDHSRFNKLEKADILEMTVRHVKTLHGSEQSKYEAGFVKCAMEVKSFLQGFHDFPPDLMTRVTAHLNTTIPNSNPSKEGVSYPPSFQSVCPITRLTESVPLASLENRKGCFTIFKNVCEPVERAATNFLENATSTERSQGFILKSNAKVMQWCPPSPPPQDPITFGSQFPVRPNSPLNDDDVQEAPLNLVVSSRSHSFPLSPPSSISSSPEPYLDQKGFQIKTPKEPTIFKPEEINPIVREIGRPETSRQFSKANLESSLVRPTINPFHDTEALHWRPWFQSP